MRAFFFLLQRGAKKKTKTKKQKKKKRSRTSVLNSTLVESGEKRKESRLYHPPEIWIKSSSCHSLSFCLRYINIKKPKKTTPNRTNIPCFLLPSAPEPFPASCLHAVTTRIQYKIKSPKTLLSHIPSYGFCCWWSDSPKRRRSRGGREQR